MSRGLVLLWTIVYIRLGLVIFDIYFNLRDDWIESGDLAEFYETVDIVSVTSVAGLDFASIAKLGMGGEELKSADFLSWATLQVALHFILIIAHTAELIFTHLSSDTDSDESEEPMCKLGELQCPKESIVEGPCVEKESNVDPSVDCSSNQSAATCEEEAHCTWSTCSVEPQATCTAVVQDTCLRREPPHCESTPSVSDSEDTESAGADREDVVREALLLIRTIKNITNFVTLIIPDEGSAGVGGETKNRKSVTSPPPSPLRDPLLSSSGQSITHRARGTIVRAVG